MSDEPEQSPPAPERPWGERMMDWAREKVGADAAPIGTGETASSDAPAPEARQPDDALAPIDFPRDKREFDDFPLHKALGLTLEEVHALSLIHI